MHGVYPKSIIIKFTKALLSVLPITGLFKLSHINSKWLSNFTQELASRSRVPLPTVSKLCKELSRAGIVVSHRGRHGGYALARGADVISVAEIVEALEGPISLTECGTPGGDRCGIEASCLAKASWDPVSRAIQGALQQLPLSAIGPFRMASPPREAAPAALPVLPGAHHP